MPLPPGEGPVSRGLIVHLGITVGGVEVEHGRLSVSDAVADEDVRTAVGHEVAALLRDMRPSVEHAVATAINEARR